MKTKLLAKNLDLTEAISDYVLKRVTNLGKLITKLESKGGEAVVNFEVSKNTKHKAGSVFHSDCTLVLDGKKFYASADKEDLYEAVDAVKELLFREISQNKDKKQTLKTRGARSVKKMMKGLSARNPETATYKKKK
ncbi:MAG: ribosome-associated translation inhibitor RaiA [Candidatus Pacebacteria bacterium]|nr:ribosome-associated translation inhibitor RaiA [Candidatus Paceibacterota bacterium]